MALYHLLKIKRYPRAKQKEFEDLAVNVADHKLESKYPNFAKFRRHPDAEVRFIAEFLRSRTREVDTRFYLIRFNQLQGILHRFGYELANPSGNYIDIVKIEKKRIGIFERETQLVRTKVAQVGFPGWKAQVTRNAH